MVEVFNEGLEAKDFRYFIARGQSAERLAAYQAASLQFRLDVQHFADSNHGGIAHLFNRRWQTEIDGLDFGGRRAPEGWQDSSHNVKTPTHATADSTRARREMHDLRLGHPHLFLGITPKGETGGKFLVPVVRPALNTWIIASPVVDGEAFVPKDSIEIDPQTYATMTGQDPAALQSPATDEAYQNPFMREYPFRPMAGAAPALKAV